MAETMQIDRLIQDPSRIRIVSDKLFSRYKNKLGAAIGVSLHMGNWELSIWPFVVANANPAAVYRSVNNPTSTSICAGSGAISIRAACSGAARSRASTATTRRRRAS